MADPRSYGERKASEHVSFLPNPAPAATEADEAARRARNLEEWKKARILALRANDPKAAKILDNEMAGNPVDFPSDGIDFLEDDGIDFQPDVPAAAQADVRKAEKRDTPMAEQSVDERRFSAARQGWMRATGGVLKPGQTQAQAISEWSGVKDPAETRGAAEAQHAAQTGELPADDTLAYEAAKMLAGIGGFALGGPAGATALEMGTRYASLKRRLAAAEKAGLSEEESDTILARELVSGVGQDAAFNFGIPILGQWIAKLSGKVKLGEKFAAALEKAFGPTKDLRASKIDKLASKTADPARQQAVRELAKRVPDDTIPTPGQVRGEFGAVETAVNKTFPVPFEAQEKTLGTAAEGMRRELLYPGGQPARQTLGERIVQTADDTARATKERLRPAFKAADDIGVAVDMRSAVARARAALKNDAAVPGGKLAPRERADLQALVDSVGPGGNISAEAALDFISRQKEKLRATAEYTPSSFYDTIVNGLMKDANSAFETAIRETAAKHRLTGDILAVNRQAEAAGTAYKAATGTEKVLTDLLSARAEYRKMMETVFDDAMKQALRKEAGGTPEDIGAFLWQNGKVSRIEQLNELLGLAQKEGKLSPARAAKMQRDVTRGFLQEAVRDVKTASEWSERLAKDPRLADTWKVLTSTPAGAELREGMKVLEQAAQIATVANTEGSKIRTPIPVGRAAGLGLGISYVTGAFSPGLIVAGLSVAGLMKMMSTAYVRGDKGTINLVAKVLRARNAGTAASIKALQTGLLPALEKAALEYGAEDLFETAGGNDMVEAPPGYGVLAP